MKQKLVATAIGLALTSSIAVADNGLKTNIDKISYSIGVDLGKNFKKQNIAVNPKALKSGVAAGLGQGKMKMTDEEMRKSLEDFQKELIAKRTATFKKTAEENKKIGEEFLSKNKEKPGVVTLDSGLQYKILKKGDGTKPSKDDTVAVEYTGSLINGNVFDSTDKSGKPATFKLSQVIPGWTEVLQLMPAGSEWEVYIPANLAYGERSVGGPIGPNETLIFKINLLSVQANKS